jgi:hypothetical protein
LLHLPEKVKAATCASALDDDGMVSIGIFFITLSLYPSPLPSPSPTVLVSRSCP